jgi:hypothetical protein
MKVARRPWRSSDGRIGVQFMFWCPGCESVHGPNDLWFYNGDAERPTFSPSILVRSSYRDLVCHSFVTDGRIHFLADSTHVLAGQTVDLPNVPDWLVREDGI